MSTTTLFPVGKGMYINYAAGLAGNVERVVQAAHDLQLDWVSLKVGNAGDAYQSAAVGAICAALKQAGVRVWGWHYIYGVNPVAEGNRSVERVRTLQLDGLMIDAEPEFDRAGMNVPARTYCNLLRQLDLTQTGIGLNSFRYWTVHRVYPWSTFLDVCSFHIPQVYWEQDDRPIGPVDQLARSYKELMQLKPLPFVPLGMACMDQGWKPTPQQVGNFNAAVLALKLPGVGWYEWGAALAQPELFAAVTDANGWRAVDPAPAPVPDAGVSRQVVGQFYANQQAMLTDLQQGHQGIYSPWEAQ